MTCTYLHTIYKTEITKHFNLHTYELSGSYETIMAVSAKDKEAKQVLSFFFSFF